MESKGDFNKNQYNAYQHATEAVSEVQQVIMLYDGAINFIKQAKEAIREENFEKRYNLINRAIAIITGLNSCLEFNEATEDTAKALDEFYQSIDMRLLFIQCDNDTDACDRVIEDLKTMRAAWADVAEKESGKKTPPKSPAKEEQAAPPSTSESGDKPNDSTPSQEVHITA